MKAFTVCEGMAAPLLRDNIDTDLIVRIERIAQLRRGGFAPWAFETWRYLPDGRENPDFILNQGAFRQTRIILGGANFGCGSSREMAVWALEEFGVRAVVAPSFGDIFFNNCLQSGLLPITLPKDTIASLAHVAQAGKRLTVDLLLREIRAPGLPRVAFFFPDAQREALLSGLDEIDQTLQLRAEIDRFQRADALQRPWIHQAGA